MRRKKDFLSEGLSQLVSKFSGRRETYFVTADARSVGYEDGLGCVGSFEKVGVVAVPNVVFYDNAAEGQHLIRFTFCKSLDVLDEAVTRLQGLR